MGHYIKINHRWFDHPFVRRIFRITSEDEVAIIRNARLTKLFVDHARSTPVAPPEAPQRPPEEEQRVAERTAALMAEKQEEFGRIQEHRAALEAVALRYGETVAETGELLELLNAADPGSAKLLASSTGKLVRSTKEFPRKEEAAAFIRKTPHLINHGAAGCYQLTESREVAKDGKATVTTIRQDIWTLQEIASMSRTG